MISKSILIVPLAIESALLGIILSEISQRLWRAYCKKRLLVKKRAFVNAILTATNAEEHWTINEEQNNDK